MPLISSIMGNFGKYHLWLCFIIFMSKFGVAFHQMAIIFLAPPVSFTCPNNNECCERPVYNMTTFSKTIVTEWNLICGRSWLKDLNQALFQFGVLSGSLLFGVASDRFGRRPALIVAVVMEIFLGIMTSFLPDFWSFTIVRMILGASVGGIMVVGFVIVMEYVGNIYRDIVSSLFHVPFTVGHIFLGYFGYLIRDYSYFQLGISVVNIFLFLYICILPESPRWLLVMNKTAQAAKLLENVARINNLSTENIQQQMELYQLKYVSEKGRKKGNIIDLFRNPNLRKNMIVMSFTWLVSSYCFYGVSHYISHLTGDIYVNVIASGSVCLLACVTVIPLMKMTRRRPLIVASNVLASISLLSIALMPEGRGSIIVGCVGIFFSFMVFVVAYLYCSEMFPTVVRNAAIGFSSMMARLGAMIAPFVVGFRPYGMWCAPVAFGIFPLIAAALCLLLPETKNCELLMTIEEGEAFGKRPDRSMGRNADVQMQEVT
ncbi:organic cation transporter protein-like [Epargyreus clarus]|uniref:organic cation transporter protein-like n=1 Tax=Epargyreus clarus TaxID=520877 RepID=UPI003C2E1A6C